jgi:hypothetical protein
MPQHEQRKRRLIFAGLVFALVAGVGLTIWPWLPRHTAPAPGVTTGSAVTVGASDEKLAPSAPATIAAPAPAPAPAAPATVSSEEIAAAKNDLGLDPAQRKTIEDFAAQHAGDRVTQDVKVAVGAEVPAQVELRDMPLSLADALSAYSSDQYFLAPRHFVIVSKQTRRVVAVIPLGA